MSLPIYIAVFALTIILQFTLISRISVKGVMPDLVLIMIIAIALQKGRVPGVVMGFFGGLIFDVFGTGFVGLSSLANALAAYFIGFFGGGYLERPLGIVIGLLFVSFLIHDVAYFTILSMGTSFGFFKILFYQILPQTFYTLVVTIIIYLTRPKLFLGTLESN